MKSSNTIDELLEIGINNFNNQNDYYINANIDKVNKIEFYFLINYDK